MSEPSPRPAAARRFTLDGSDALESRLAEICARVAHGVREIIPARQLDALVLGGGYGRGEGGVLQEELGDAPYNDLEFYVFVRGNTVINDGRFKQRLDELGEILTPHAGLHVEFKISSLAALRRGPVTMYSYDLVSGHRVIIGAEPVFTGCDAHLNPKNIPLPEATRLLFNRCTGLLLAEARFQRPALTPEDVDFINRNVAKCQLALGDVVLAALGEYHWSVERRQATLHLAAPPKDLDWLPLICDHHTAGADFKLHPRRALPQGTNARARQVEVCAMAQRVWLWLERRRLGRPFATGRDYALDRGNKCPETSAFKNSLINVRTFGWRGTFESGLGRYPRERLFNSLALLLWHPEEIRDVALQSRLRDQLVCRGADWTEFVAAYTQMWRRFS